MICANVIDGLVVYEKTIEKRLQAELPFMATEDILMKAVKNGGDRQALHERIRIHSIEAGKQVKMLGMPNDLVKRIASDEAFGMTEEIGQILDSKNLVGRCLNQVKDYLNDYVYPVLEANKELLTDINMDVRV